MFNLKGDLPFRDDRRVSVVGNVRGNIRRGFTVVSNSTYEDMSREELIRSINYYAGALTDTDWHSALGLLTRHEKPAKEVKARLRAMSSEGLISLSENGSRISISVAATPPSGNDAA